MYLKQTRIKDKTYLDSFRYKRCCICGNPHAVAHHILYNNNSKGKGLKPNDSDCIPLCVRCHSECHRGEKAFYDKHSLVWSGDVLKYARSLYDSYLTSK